MVAEKSGGCLSCNFPVVSLFYLHNPFTMPFRGFLRQNLTSVTPLLFTETATKLLNRTRVRGHQVARRSFMALSLAGQKTGPPEQQGAPVHTGVIAGVVSAVVLLLAFAVLVLYINSHPAASPPLYLLPVSVASCCST